MSRTRAYAQLVRLPNVFTAFADIALGAFVVFGRTGDWAPARMCVIYTALMLASGALYSAGMVWNDYFDLEQDRRERPQRPLPSGRVRRGAAAVLGFILLATGVAAAGLAGWLHNPPSNHPLAIAGMLVACIVLYDAWLKRTALGPLGMASCRFLNVLLGIAPAPELLGDPGRHLAMVVGLYILGVTWFARTEARESRRPDLAAAALVMFAGLSAAVPLGLNGTAPSPLFAGMLAFLALLVGIPVLAAIRAPEPALVQVAVKRAIMGLVVLDATLAVVYAGAAGLLILLLLVPALYLGRWIYST
jgi:4-hydroxybenzoate polyprenyltransferase